ncbi:MAG: FtsW/RodA/SpoVE family cell cycle protein [Thermomicrobiales bacterium]|nr:FtsW/RodA/SpoVE family cell cycle protein [Thermomicrobiales bacterium]
MQCWPDAISSAATSSRPPRRFRGTETLLLGLVVLYAASTAAALAIVLPATGSGPTGWPIAFAALLTLASGALTATGRGADQIALPAAAMLTAVGLGVLARLEPALADDPNAPTGLVVRQLAAIVIGITAVVALAVYPHTTTLIRRYKYTWLALGIALLLAALLFGQDIRGARLWLRVGPVQVQPSELLRIALVAYLAGYLEERRDLIAADLRVGPLRLPPLPYLLPIGLMAAVSLSILLLQNDLGAALLLFGTALGMLYAASGRGFYVAIGGAGFLTAALVIQRTVARFGIRVQNWFDPWADPLRSGYQQIQSEYALAAGGVLGAGPGRGRPDLIPDVHTDFILSAVGEEMGLLGALAVVALLLLLVWRGWVIALRADDGFERLLAVGLSLGLGLQTLLIAGGVVRLLPLTGLTLPFVSYGGSAMATNFVVVGLLLAVSRSPARRLTAASPAQPLRDAAAGRAATRRIRALSGK